MQLKSYILWLGVAVLAVSGAIWSVASEGLQRGAVPPGTLLTDVSAQGGAVSGIKVRTRAYALDLEKRDGNWVAVSHGGFPARAGVAEQLVSALTSLTPLEAKTSDPAWYAQIGVDDPAAPNSNAKAVQLIDDQGSVIDDLIVGNLSSIPQADGSMATYVRVPTAEQAVLARGAVLPPPTVGDWFGELLSIPGPQVSRVDILEHGVPALSAVRGEDGKFVLEGVDPRYAEAGSFPNDAALRKLAQSLASVAIADVRAATAPTGEARTIVFRTDQGVTVRVDLDVSATPTWIRFGVVPTDETGRALATRLEPRMTGWEFRLDQSRAAVFSASIESLLQRQAGPPADATAPAFTMPPGIQNGAVLPQ